MATNLVEVKRYLERQEADVACSMLISCGIPAEVFADNEGNMAPYLAIVTSVRLMVQEDNRSAALELLKDDDAEVQNNALGEIENPEAQRTVQVDREIQRVYVSAIFGVIVAPLGQIYSLWLACGLLGSWNELNSRQRSKMRIALFADVAHHGPRETFTPKLALKIQV